MGFPHARTLSVALAIGSLAVVLAAAWHPQVRSTAIASEFDVVVVGAAPGGVAASIQAARMGANVVLLEGTDWIGGQMTAAGVGTTDEGVPAARNGGIYHEFAQGALAYYRSHDRSVDTCYYSAASFCVDPRVGQMVLREMIGKESSHLTVLTGVHVTGIVKDTPNHVAGVIADGKTFFAKVVIDADPFGDVLAEAGAAYRIGNVTSDDMPIPPTACVQAMTYGPVIKQYPGGVPPELRFSTAPPGYSPDVAQRFARVLSIGGSAAIPGQGMPPRPMSFVAYAAYRGLPDLADPPTPALGPSRTTLDLGNDYPFNGSLSVRALTDPTFRAYADAQARLVSLQLLYYIQHDLGESTWSIANDEGYNTTYNRARHDPALSGLEAFEDQMPQQPYVREGRRVIGVETLTGSQLKTSWKDPRHIPTYPESIAVGYYPMDLHGCKNSLESAFDASTDVDRGNGGPFEVPLGVVVPVNMDGLLATDNAISVSREANGATREQPIAMSIGQAAGALAALASQRGVAPRYIPAAAVQAILVADHAVIGT